MGPVGNIVLLCVCVCVCVRVFLCTTEDKEIGEIDRDRQTEDRKGGTDRQGC